MNKKMNKALSIFTQILSVILMLMSLLILIIEPVLGIIAMGFAVFLFIFARKNMKKAIATTDQEVPATAPINNKFCCEVAGIYYHKDDAIDVMGDNPYFKAAKKYEGNRVYRYARYDGSCNLVPEPTNEHDKNAIKVMVVEKHIGYIPATKCSEVKAIMHNSYFPTLTLFGGDRRKYVDGEWFLIEGDICGEITIELLN